VVRVCDVLISKKMQMQMMMLERISCGGWLENSDHLRRAVAHPITDGGYGMLRVHTPVSLFAVGVSG
jgi:hypothetical protein